MSIEAMSDLEKAARQALEVLEYWDVRGEFDKDTRAAITDLRIAIEQMEKQEPVAWMVYTLDGKSVCVTDNPADFNEQHRVLPLYTTPPAAPYRAVKTVHEGKPVYVSEPAAQRQWVGLNEDELEKVFPAIATYHEANKTLYRSIARAIEAKLREKNA